MYELTHLNNTTAAAYQGLTFPWLKQHLDHLAPKGAYLAIGATMRSQPVGLILASVQSDTNLANILSIYVMPEHRQKGLGDALLEKIEQTLIQRGDRQVSILYPFNLTTPILEKILAQRGWSSGVPYSWVCTTDIQTLKTAPLHLYPFPSTYTLFPWQELTSQERETIQQQHNTLNYPDILSPFKEECLIEPRVSLGLRYRGEVIGWIIGNRVSEDAVYYRSLFVRADLQKVARGCSLILAALKFQIQIPELTKLTFFVMLDNSPMFKFVQRRFSPYLTAIQQYWRAEKLLTVTTKKLATDMPIQVLNRSI